MLTPEQQGYATAALDMELVPKCCDYFLRSYPCLRELLTPDEMESAAMFACASAASTYNPAKAGISAYFSKAILHELLKSCQRELKHGARSVYRISLHAAELRQPPVGKPLADAVLQAFESLTDEDRRWIERRVFDNASYRVLARAEKISTRQVQKVLRSRLDRLRRTAEESPHVSPSFGPACEQPRESAEENT